MDPPVDNRLSLPPIVPARCQTIDGNFMAQSARRVKKMLIVLREYKRGFPPRKSWAKYQITPEEYDEFERQLRDDDDLWGWVNDKVQYDYDPIRTVLIIRTQDVIHGNFLSSLRSAIFMEIKKLTNLPENQAKAGKYMERIFTRPGYFHYTNNGKRFMRDPHYAIHCADSRDCPSIVIEVSDSKEKQEDLDQLAEDYIVDSNASIRAVVVLDLKYNGKQASISVWRTIVEEVNGTQFQCAHPVLDNELFRDAEGNPVLSSAGLELPLDDFDPDYIPTLLSFYKIPAIPKLSVKFDSVTLCEWLTEAEKRYEVVNRAQTTKYNGPKVKYRYPEHYLRGLEEEKTSWMKP